MFSYTTLCIQILGHPPKSIFWTISGFSFAVILALITLFIIRGRIFLECERKLKDRKYGKTTRKQK